MQMHLKVVRPSVGGHRSPFGDVIGSIKRRWLAKTDRRTTRPLQDMDGWSDQAEVAFYEDCPAFRCG